MPLILIKLYMMIITCLSVFVWRWVILRCFDPKQLLRISCILQYFFFHKMTMNHIRERPYVCSACYGVPSGWRSSTLFQSCRGLLQQCIFTAVNWACRICNIATRFKNAGFQFLGNSESHALWHELWEWHWPFRKNIRSSWQHPWNAHCFWMWPTLNSTSVVKCE